MPAKKIAFIGHVVPSPVSIPLGQTPGRVKNQLQVFNYTRVVTEDNELVDHIAYLKKKKGLSKSETFSLWEMSLCAQIILSNKLRENGFEVKVVNYIDDHNAEDVWRELLDFEPDIIAASTTFVLTSKQFVGLGQTIREYFPNTFLVAGGHHVFASLHRETDGFARNYLTESGFDALVIDPQGEKALLDIAQTYPEPLKDIPNLVFRDGDENHVTPRAPEDNDINDTLAAFPNNKPGDIVNVRTARSCSFKCAFCSYPSIAGALVTLTMENARQTLQRAMDVKLGALFFVDDTFNVPKDRFNELLDLMIEMKFDIPWYSFMRAQYITEEIVEKMKLSGCAGVYLGIESGSDTILKAMKKGAIIDFYKRGIAWLKKANILTVGSFIMGFPGETAETAQITQDFITTTGLDYYYIQPFYYLHHTPIHEQAEKYELDGEGAFWSHKTMNWREANQHVNRIFMEVDNVEFINPDYTLWEIAYLQTKGLTLDEIKEYRREINAMTRAQMNEFGLYDSPESVAKVTSRA